MTTLSVEPLTMPGVALGPENPLPRFRDDDHHMQVATLPSLPAEKHAFLGWACGARVLPYRMQDNYTRQRVPTTYATMVLENEHLKATFLPAYGGRLLSLFHKPSNRELLNRNPVFQPANLAIRNAWFSGGIEWNVGHFGHTFATCSPVFAAAISDADGSPGLRLYEYERCTGVCWQIDFYLPAGSPWLIAHTRIANPSAHATSMYWWTNTAVDERPDVRVLAPCTQVIYTDLTEHPSRFGYADMPHLDTFQHRDASYSTNAHAASEYFFQPDTVDMPWEAALGADGSGFIEASTARLRYRKMFCWGMHQGGRHWQEFLGPGGSPYLEIQAGLAPSQLHGLQMPAHSDWHWTQVFGHFQGEAAIVHHPDWETAWRGVDATLKQHLSVAQLAALDAHYTARADHAPDSILQHGSGWGALEVARRHHHGEPALAAAFAFPSDTLTSVHHQWLNLLTHGQFPAPTPDAAPGDWMVQPTWYRLLAELPAHAHTWYSQLHLGVMHMEAGDKAAARAAWQASIALQPTAWAWRNLAIIALRAADTTTALDCYQQAWLAQDPVLEIAQEYIELLCRTAQFAHALAIYDTLPDAFQHNDRILIMRCRMALELGDFATVERLVQHEYAVVREGESELTDLWFRMWYQRTSPDAPLTAAEQAEVRRRYPPPAHIDFRMIVN